MTSSNLYLIDASHFIFRAYHALPPLENVHGVQVGAVYGFLSMILKIINANNINYLGVVFDSKAPTFRHTLYSAYKANRPPPPPELSIQFGMVKDACIAFDLPVIQKDGLEADDLMATYAHHMAQENRHTTFISSDKDLMQLISPHINMLDPVKNVVIDTEAVKAKFGVSPDQLCDMQALMGDASDNIPGVPGIGPKTAATLIQSFQSLDGIYDHLDDITRPRVKELLITHRDNAFLSQKLAKLCTDAPRPLPMDALSFKGITLDSARDFLQAHGFDSLVRRLAQTTKATTEAPSMPWTTLDLETAASSGWETPFVRDGVVSAAQVKGGGLALFHPENGAMLLSNVNAERLKPLFEDRSLVVLGHDILTQSRDVGRIPAAFDDTLLMAYLLFGPSSKTIIQHYNDLIGNPLPTFSNAPPECLQAFQGAFAAWHVTPVLRDRLIKQGLWALYETVDKPLLATLKTMEDNGILLNPDHLKALGKRFDHEIATQEARIFDIAGHTFNAASPKQLSAVLFDELKLKAPGKKGKTGNYSTDAAVIEKLDHPIKEPLLIFRQLSKLKNTYITGLLNSVDPKTSRVHTKFISCGTSTGRLASADPNLQNIPIRDKESQEIRKAFVASPGHMLLSIDYSQIELRLLAHMGDVTPLIDAFHHGADIHQQTASEMFETPLNEITEDQRRSAKMINFGIIYGMSAYGLSDRLNIPKAKAEAYIERYFQRYPGIKAYMDAMIAKARTKGYVTTLWGRQCFTHHIQDKNPNLRAMAERLAINAPLQGTSADLIRRAMVDIQAYLCDHPSSLKLLLQIHDELLFEGTPEDIEAHQKALITILTSVAHLNVPLIATPHIGTSWHAAH
jgi:DNA polymerase-1